MAGEDSHEKGRTGLLQAQQWLERSSRIKTSFRQTDSFLGDRLHFRWPNDNEFSFDLGGQFRGEELEGKTFMAEVKKYSTDKHLAEHYKLFLAQCYVAFDERPNYCDNLIWISWVPFTSSKWHEHTTINAVRAAVLAHSDKIFGQDAGAVVAADLIDTEILSGVADRVWLLTLCDQQLGLVMTLQHYSEIVQSYVLSEGGT